MPLYRFHVETETVHPDDDGEHLDDDAAEAIAIQVLAELVVTKRASVLNGPGLLVYVERDGEVLCTMRAARQPFRRPGSPSVRESPHSTRRRPSSAPCGR